MKLKKLIPVAILLSLFSIALIAQANFSHKNFDESQITFNSKNHSYYPTSSISYLSQPIEQKYLTIMSINAIEASLEENGPAKSK